MDTPVCWSAMAASMSLIPAQVVILGLFMSNNGVDLGEFSRIWIWILEYCGYLSIVPPQGADNDLLV
jgi:hypothetical protein